MVRIALVLTSLAPSTALAGPAWSLAYHGDFLTHPGASARASWPTSDNPRAALHLEAEAGAYWHPKNLVGTFLRAGPALSLEGARGGLWGVFVHGGGLLGTWAAPTYVVDVDGPRRSLAGRAWATVTPGLELGRRTPGTRGIDAWFVRPQLGMRLPTAHGVGLDLAVQVGLRLGGDA
ncbi:MAG: hypothetical protein KTR31_40465 [Myxococcales bacterium]|nr:hypothetical protein [Myxococcales bacterium]